MHESKLSKLEKLKKKLLEIKLDYRPILWPKIEYGPISNNIGLFHKNRANKTMARPVAKLFGLAYFSNFGLNLSCVPLIQ